MRANLEPFGVNTSMTVYIITNLIDNKKYVGITCREDFNKRWVEHKSAARRKTKNISVINRAIRKHGEENFKFEVVGHYPNLSIEELLQKESELIMENDSLVPKGYNIQSISEYAPATEEIKESRSLQQQGIKKGNTSKFIGVYKERNSFRFEIARRRKKYNKGASSEIEAARGYDKMAIYFYGRTAKTNFPIENYSQEEVDEFYENFFIENRSALGSKYKHLYFDKRRNEFVARHKRKYLGSHKSEEEAYKLLENYFKQQDEQNNN